MPSKELLLLEALCEELGFSVDFEAEQSIPSGQILVPAKYTLTRKKDEALCDEHICENCGGRGWSANCDKCIPY